MSLICKHGAPVTWDIKPADWNDERKNYIQRITVTMCKTCVEEGIAEAIAKQIEGALLAQMRG